MTSSGSRDQDQSDPFSSIPELPEAGILCPNGLRRSEAFKPHLGKAGTERRGMRREVLRQVPVPEENLEIKQDQASPTFDELPYLGAAMVLQPSGLGGRA